MLESAWDFYTKTVEADFYLFQEGRPADGLPEGSKFVWKEIGGTRAWGSGIYSDKYPLGLVTLDTQHDGAVVVGESTLTNGISLILISLYGLLEKVGTTKYAITTLHRMFSDLTGILNNHTGDYPNIILGGDLNASVQWDEYYGGEAHRILFERIADFGLVNCFTPFYSDYIKTIRHPRSDKPWQTDYFFVSKQLKGNLKSCEVLDNDEIRMYSDHNPVVIELEV